MSASVPCFPPWMPPEQARLWCLEGSPYRAQATARAATHGVIWRHLAAHTGGMHLAAATLLSVVLALFVAVTLAAVR